MLKLLLLRRLYLFLLNIISDFSLPIFANMDMFLRLLLIFNNMWICVFFFFFPFCTESWAMVPTSFAVGPRSGTLTVVLLCRY